MENFQFFTFALACAYQWQWMAAVYSRILALVRVWGVFFFFISFYQKQEEQGHKGAQRYGMTSTEGESMQGLWFEYMYMHTHTQRHIMSLQHPLHLAIGRFEIVAQGHAGSFRDPWQSKVWPQGCSYN